MVDAASAPASDVEVVEAEASDGVRSPVDVLRLLVAVFLVVAVLVADALFGETLVSFASELFAGLSAVPDWIVDVVVLGSRVLAAVLLVVGLAVVLRTGRWRVAATLVLAAGVAAGLMALLDVFDPAPDEAPVEVIAPGFPSAAGLAAVTAATTAAAPWLSRGWRQWGWIAVGGLAVTRFLSTPASLATVEAVLLGWLVGAAAVVALGGPWRRPRGQAVAAGLADVGVPLVRLEQASLDARGSTPYFATTAGGDRLFVKTLGDDERSADRLFRLYRRVVPRDLGDERPFSSLRRAVEHEALLALTARDVGVRTPHLVALARAQPKGFTLAYEAIEGRSLDRLAPDEVTDEVLAAVWDEVAVLRAHRIAHRDLRLANIFLAEDGQVWLIDFGFSEMAAADVLLATDVAELVASSAVQVGAARAAARAVAAVDGPTLGAAQDRLHPWALSGATREALRERVGLLDDVRARIGAAV
jgi:undecaprenyl-diphosphatase